ncbi:hypothetical protein DCAR_0832833 [Daucus carota subsp. sativus]|uniref:Splicing factor 3A subunit 1 n=1 Tax=Daucus carota subsp. sativus TaxID=79200 RepID=A0AAF1BBA8_DAUCS|nr:PREDICTED: probable splicing factor 3A subunit 1 [Daucus carota subsp. sativus]WOH13324.1 hypothetical protein DCAR_0832833 [Daucus carota subsp. sativus]
MLGSTPILPLPAPPIDGNLGPLPPSELQDREILDDIEEEARQASSASVSVATHTKTIGLIHPPPDIRTIVEKTARSVAKVGKEFEHRIMKNYPNNPKFNFLKSSDPYHAYYQHRLSEFRSQNSTSQQPIQASDASGLESAKPDPSEPFRKPLEPPAAEQYTVGLPEGITGEELDMIKLTAQFVARNGKSFHEELSRREGNNPQFNFMKPKHSILFKFFTSLVDAYSKVLMPPKGLTDKLQSSVDSMTTILERCLHRLEWERSQEQARQNYIMDEVRQERKQMARKPRIIDWHNFVVVERIDFANNEDDDLPAPMTLEEVTRRSKMSTLEEEGLIAEPGKEVEMEMDEEEVQLFEQGMRVASLEENGCGKQSEATITPMRIVKNWKRPEERNPAERDSTKYVVSPITGELILINEMSEHMRISLIDPKYKEQKERMFAKIRDSTTLAQDDDISKNIMGLARTRPDLFGTTEEEVSNAVKAEIEKKKYEQPKQVIWDGHTGSIGRTLMYTPLTAPRPYAPHVMPQHGMHMVHPPMPLGIPPPPPPEEAPPLPEEPEPKRQRLGDSMLIPEDQFLAQHQGPASIHVSVPNVDEGNLKGQVLEIRVQSLSETVSRLKEEIAGEIQLPSNKQKLSGKAGFLKDHLSLAYYNVSGGETLSLSLRERGGRKK